MRFYGSFLMVVSFLTGAAMTASFCSCGSKPNPNEKLGRDWKKLCAIEGSTDGSQHYNEEDGISMESVFYADQWQEFFARPPKEVVPFLVKKFESSNEVPVTVSPWGNKTTEGALAVYASEHLLRRNWYEVGNEYSKLARYRDIYYRQPAHMEPFILKETAAMEEMQTFFSLCASNYVPKIESEE